MQCVPESIDFFTCSGNRMNLIVRNEKEIVRLTNLHAYHFECCDVCLKASPNIYVVLNSVEDAGYLH